MQKVRKAYILNLCLFVLEVFAIAWMMSGIHSGVLSTSGIQMLKYFTVDSNILMGVFALIAAIDQRRVLRGKKSEVSLASYVLKLVGTVGVTLTMLVTVFFLEPTMGAVFGYFALFSGSNFLLHLLNPVLSLVIFLCFEKTDRIPFKHTLTGTVPMVLYAVYYVAAAALHSQNGVVAEGYDWYGFLVTGIRSALIIVPLLVLITYAISFVLWKLNRRKAEHIPA